MACVRVRDVDRRRCDAAAVVELLRQLDPKRAKRRFFSSHTARSRDVVRDRVVSSVGNRRMVRCAHVAVTCRLLGCGSLNNRYGYVCAHLHCRQFRARSFRRGFDWRAGRATPRDEDESQLSARIASRRVKRAVLMNTNSRPFGGRASVCGRLANHTLRCCHSTAVGDLNAHRARRDPCSWVSKDVTLLGHGEVRFVAVVSV